MAVMRAEAAAAASALSAAEAMSAHLVRLAESAGEARVVSLQAAVAQVLAAGAVKTPDLGGKATTTQMGDAVVAAIG